MINNKYILTEEGHRNLLKELDLLKMNNRPKAVERLRKAREMGDLSENSEYTAAREDLSFMDGRILEIETMLKNLQIVSKSKNSSIVDIGSKVHVEINGLTEIFMIVGEMEADLTANKLSHVSPIGKALLGSKKGDKVIIDIPAGKATYVVLNIE